MSFPDLINTNKELVTASPLWVIWIDPHKNDSALRINHICGVVVKLRVAKGSWKERQIWESPSHEDITSCSMT